MVFIGRRQVGFFWYSLMVEKFNPYKLCYSTKAAFILEG